MVMKFQDLNEKQLEAVNQINGPILIVAGAGSGKTRTLTNRLINLLSNGIAPENIIAITFTNKAANEMKDRVEKMLGDKVGDYQNLFVGTFHSLGARILRKEAGLLKRTAGFTIFDSDDSRSLVKKTIKNFNLTEKDKNRITPAFLEREFSKIKNELKNSEDIYDEKIELLFADYENGLQRNNAFDFDDLIEKPVRIFQKHPDVLSKYQNQFHYVLVDEYQDTNSSQYFFIKLLADKHKNLSVVGDDQQSIFGFRGSDFRNFLNFETDWPKAKVVVLEENYRSTSNIIEAASSVIANNKFQKPKKLWTNNQAGESIKIIEHDNADYEADWVADSIKRRFLSDPNQTAAVLYRTNAQSRAMEQFLIEKNLPYQIFGGIRFYERKEIKDLVAALRYALNPADEISLSRLEKSFLKKPYLELKADLPRKGSELKPTELIGYIIKTADYIKGLEKNFTNSSERIENIGELVDFSTRFENLADFLEKISLLQPLDNIKNKPVKNAGKLGVANLMSIHLAKGLEFDAVYLIGANEGLLPHQMSYYSEAEIEEERRLMYVAMTRAKKELYLNFYHLPSRFLHEIAPEFVEFVGQKSLDDEERYIEID